MTALSDKRVLAVDLSSRGFGYAVLEAEKLVDWGIRRVSGKKNAACLDSIRQLFHWYVPEVLALEDCRAVGSRRRARIQALSDQVVRLAGRLEVDVALVHWSTVQQVVGGSAKATKEQVVARVAETFPELRRQAPPKRKPWMSEDERTNLFDAVALGMGAKPSHGSFQIHLDRTVT